MTTFRIPSAAEEVLPGVGDFSGCHYSQQSTKNEANLGRVRSSCCGSRLPTLNLKRTFSLKLLLESSSISSKDSTVVPEVLYEC